MIKILMVAGASRDFMKLAPLYFELRKHPGLFHPEIVHNGQHLDYDISEAFLKQLQLPEVDYPLEDSSGSHAYQTGAAMIEIEQVLCDHKPDMVVVFGDLNSALAAAISAAKMRIPVAHVEAGLRSYDRDMPEEINRVVSDILADLLFTHCDNANLNLIREGIAHEKIYLVGNIMIDTLKHFLPKSEKTVILEKLGLSGKKYVLTTLHRPSNVDNPENLDKIVKIITSVAERIKIVFPMHPRTRKSLENHEACCNILQNMNIVIAEPLGYLDYLKLEKHALAVLTDSGGVQEETTVLGVPCLTMRESTERPVTITDGTNKLVGLNHNKIISLIDFYLQSGRSPKRCPILWDGQTAERIVRVFAEYFSTKSENKCEKEAITALHQVAKVLE